MLYTSLVSPFFLMKSFVLNKKIYIKPFAPTSQFFRVSFRIKGKLTTNLHVVSSFLLRWMHIQLVVHGPPIEWVMDKTLLSLEVMNCEVLYPNFGLITNQRILEPWFIKKMFIDKIVVGIHAGTFFTILF